MCLGLALFFFKQKTAYEMRISDWSSDVCSSDLISYAGVVIVGVGLIAEGVMTMGGLIACSILSGRAVAPLGQIATLLSRMTATRTAYRQLNGLMTTPAEGPAGEPLDRKRAVWGTGGSERVDTGGPPHIKKKT